MFPSNYFPARYFAPRYWPDQVVAVTTTAPRVLMRGVVQRAEITTGLLASITAVDSLFAEFGPFGPNQMWPPIIPASLFSSAPAGSVNRPFPVVYGEKSDEGAVDPLTSAARSKGLVPLLYVGQQQISDLGVESPDPPDIVPDGSIPAPTIVSVNNAVRRSDDPGGFTATTYIYGATEVDGVVGTLTTWPSSPFDPLGVTEPQGVDLNISFDSNYVTGYGDTGGQRNVRHLFWASTDPLYHPFTNPNAGAQIGTVTHDDLTHDSVYGTSMFTALLKPSSSATSPDSGIWDAYLVCLGASFRILSLYGSDLGKGISTNTPDRTKLVLAEHSGSDLLIPWDANGDADTNWPFDDPFIDYTDDNGTTYRCTMLFMRGPISDDHKNGVVNLAVNMIGREQVGDGSGYPLIDAHAIEQHLFENEFLAHTTSGLWATDATAPKFSDGTPIVRSSTFRDRQAFLATAFGGRGLTFGFAYDAQKSVTDWVRLLMRDTESRTGTNGQGQIVKFGLDPDVDTSTWPRVDHVSDLFGPLRRFGGEDRENVMTGACDWDPDAERFRSQAEPVRDANAILKYKGRVRQGDAIESVFLNDSDQLDWVLARRLERVANPSIYVECTGGIGFLDYDVGDGILLTSEEGTGTDGYEDHPFIIVRRRLNLASLLVTYTLWDVAALLT